MLYKPDLVAEINNVKIHHVTYLFTMFWFDVLVLPNLNEKGVWTTSFFKILKCRAIFD